MSTKAIREALDTLEAYADTDEDWAQHAAAMKSVEAIERAAKERCELAEAVAEGDKDALERLAQLACDERNASIKEGRS